MMTYLVSTVPKVSPQQSRHAKRVSPAIAELVPDVDGMVSALDVVLVVLLIFCHDAS